MNEEVEVNELSQSISANYLLANVTVRTYGGQRTDRELTAEIHQTKGAANSTGRYVRNLFGDRCNRLREVAAGYNSMRNFLYHATLPWVSDDTGAKAGDRLLPVVASMQFLADFNNRRQAAAVLRDKMADDLPEIIEEARARMGSMAPPLSEYPSATEFKRHFDATLEVSPVPEVADFSRLSVPGKLATGLAGIYERRQVRQLDNAKEDAVNRTAKALRAMSQQLRKEADGGKTRFYQSMIDNVSREVGLLGALGASADTKLELIAREAYDNILKHVKEVGSYKKNIALCNAHSNEAARLAALLVGEPEPEVVVVDEPVVEEVKEDDLDAQLEDALAAMGMGAEVHPEPEPTAQPDASDMFVEPPTVTVEKADAKFVTQEIDPELGFNPDDFVL